MGFREKPLSERTDEQLYARADTIIQIVNRYEAELNEIGEELRRRLGFVALGDMELVEAC